jgi:hypothetical protein
MRKKVGLWAIAVPAINAVAKAATAIFFINAILNSPFLLALPPRCEGLSWSRA